MEKSYLELIQIHRENKLAGLHPGIKFLVVVLYSVCTFVLASVHFTRASLSLLPIAWYLLVILLCAASGEFRKCMKAMKAVVLVAGIIFLVQTFIVPGGDVLWRMGFLRICQNGLKTGVSLSWTIMDIAGIFVWLFQTTENKEISRALEESGMNYKVAYVFTSTFQMIDLLSSNSKTIMNAQQARGVETEGNLIVRMKAFVPSLIPLILGAVIGSEERVLTLEARGFSIQGEKTHLFNLERSGLENTMKILSIGITVVIIAGRILLWVL